MNKEYHDLIYIIHTNYLNVCTKLYTLHNVEVTNIDIPQNWKELVKLDLNEILSKLMINLQKGGILPLK